MGLFTKVNCAECGNPAKAILRAKLQDGNYICPSCCRSIPYYAYQSYLEEYTLEMYRFFKEYKKYSDEELRPVFQETISYASLHLDENNGLFYIGLAIDKKTVFLKLENLLAIDLVFKPKEVKSGITGQKVEGDVLIQLVMNEPYFKYEDKLIKDVKAKAKKELFGTKVVYDNPKGMDEFCDAFARAWEPYINARSSSAQQSQPSEFQQAMALFMLDSLEGVTIQDLKAHRNRMIKAFHPDKGGAADDTRYAQKINNAYEVLKNYVESHS